MRGPGETVLSVRVLQKLQERETLIEDLQSQFRSKILNWRRKCAAQLPCSNFVRRNDTPNRARQTCAQGVRFLMNLLRSAKIVRIEVA